MMRIMTKGAGPVVAVKALFGPQGPIGGWWRAWTFAKAESVTFTGDIQAHLIEAGERWLWEHKDDYGIGPFRHTMEWTAIDPGNRVYRYTIHFGKHRPLTSRAVWLVSSTLGLAAWGLIYWYGIGGMMNDSFIVAWFCAIVYAAFTMPDRGRG